MVAAGAGVAVNAPSDEVAERMAAEGGESYQQDVGCEDERTHADAELSVEEVGPDGVPPQDEDEDDRYVQGETVEVLQDERELALTGVVLALGYLLHRARRRVPEEGPVVGEAVVVAGQAEEEGESD